MASQPLPYLTPRQYLALDRAAETKSEYRDGLLVPIDVVQENHGLIVGNLERELSLQFKPKPGRIYAADMRVWVAEGGMYAYPDVVAVARKPEFEDDERDVLLNPTLIVEVVSETSEAYDRGLKFARYRQQASIVEYVLVAQDWIGIERWSRHGRQWMLTEATNLDATIDLPSIACSLALRDVYDKVQGLSAIA